MRRQWIKPKRNMRGVTRPLLSSRNTSSGRTTGFGKLGGDGFESIKATVKNLWNFLMSVFKRELCYFLYGPMEKRTNEHPQIVLKSREIQSVCWRNSGCGALSSLLCGGRCWAFQGCSFFRRAGDLAQNQAWHPTKPTFGAAVFSFFHEREVNDCPCPFMNLLVCW